MHHPPSEKSEQRRARSPYVGLRIDLARLGVGLLWGHEGWCTEQHSRSGSALWARGGGVTRTGDTEVEDFEGGLPGDEQIGGFDVAMDNRLGVGRGEHLEELVHNGDGGVEGHPAAAAVAQVLHRGPFEELHHEERCAVFRHVVVDDANGARMLHGVGDIPLAKESGANVLTNADLRVQQLDGELGLVPVRGGVDRGHAPHAKDAVDAVFAAQDRAHAVLRSTGDVVMVGHRTLRISYGPPRYHEEGAPH